VKTERADVVVIGAGLGGLSAAGYLAKAGNRVVVLEHHAVPGGYAHEFRRGKYRIEVSLHALDGMDPGGWTHSVFEDLEVLDQVPFQRLDPYYTARFPEHEFSAHLDPLLYERDMARLFPDEAEGLNRLFADMKVVYRQGREWVSEKMINGPALTRISEAFPQMVESVSVTWADYMRRYIRDPKLMSALSVLWGYHGLPPSRLKAANAILSWGSYHLDGAYYPAGGSMAMSRAVEKTIRKYGGQVHYRQTVERIEVRDGKAFAAETAQGLRVEGDIFISNASPKDTLLKFVGPRHLPASYLQKVDTDQPHLGCIAVYLALDRDLLAEGWPHHELLLFTTYDLDADYAASISGDWDKVNMAITHYNHADPTCSPAGGSVLVLLSLADWNYADQWGTGGDLANYGKNPRYQELKNAAAERMIDRAEACIPGLRDSIKYSEVATPLTNARYTRNPNGSIYGAVPALNNLASRISEITPISNLLLTGAWVSNGGMSTALLSGASAAIKACDVLAREAPRRPAQEWAAASGGTLDRLAELSHDEVAMLLAQELGVEQGLV
jgi:phytoene dehydrogenase-like protein